MHEDSTRSAMRTVADGRRRHGDDARTDHAVLATQSHTTPAGTTVRTSSSNHGEPVVEETRHYDSAGRELLEAPGGNQPSSSGQRRITDIEVEDVTDETEADKLYRERMEDEYAKREGGA
ncbi:hypothetical protein MBLNU459_g1330t1 [Dothideomycetes sp. NU459]